MDNNYCVYVHILPNDKRYYGMSKSIKHRWRNKGCDYKYNIEFYEAIQLYGWDNISHIIVAKGLTKDEAKWLEEELIRTHKTYDSEYGYNKFIGNKLTNKYKEAMSKNRGGENNPMYGRIGANNPMYGKYHTIETKLKMSEANSGINSSNHKPVICITTNTIFSTITEASNYYGIATSSISKCCKKKRSSAGKFNGKRLVWHYIDIIEL